MSTERKKQLRKDIIEKFETIKYFCKLCGYSYSNFKTFLNSRTPNEEMYQDAIFKLNDTEVTHIEGNIRDEDREEIRKCIVVNYSSYSAFCRKHTDFNSLYISNIMKGRLKFETSKYRKLIAILERDYNLSLRKEVTES